MSDPELFTAMFTDQPRSSTLVTTQKDEEKNTPGPDFPHEFDATVLLNHVQDAAFPGNFSEEGGNVRVVVTNTFCSCVLVSCV